MYENYNISRNYSPSVCSVESFADENRQTGRSTIAGFFNRQRSVTISTTGSSVETATNAVTASTAIDHTLDHALEAHNKIDGTGQGKSSEPYDKMAARTSRLDHLQLAISSAQCPGKGLPSAAPASVGSCGSSDGSVMSMSSEARCPLGNRNTASRVPVRTAGPSSALRTVALQQIEENSPRLGDSLHDVNALPLPTGPILIHRSSPPWMVSGRDEVRALHPNSSTTRLGPDEQSVEFINQSHQSRQSASQSHPKAGLKKLLKSVKVSLWSSPSSGNTPDLARNKTDDKLDSHLSQQPWSFSNQSSLSCASVDAHSMTALARNHPNHFSMVGPDESTDSLSRSVSAGSISTIGTTTSSTFPSASITPSSSWSSLPGAQADSPITNQAGPDGTQDQRLGMTTSLGPGKLDRYSNMAHTLSCTHAPSRCFENSFSPNNLLSKQEPSSPSTKMLKSKPSFGFLQNLKRAVTGVDNTLSFSFHNHLTPSLSTSAVSLPIGTVLRNNGLDPLPPCHPLPLRSSLSSPSNLDCSFLAPTRQEGSGPSPRAVSLFSSDLSGNCNITLSPSQLDDPNSSVEVLRVPPTLNLRPVSMPFAAGFSDQFLLGVNLIDSEEDDSEDQSKTETTEHTCAHRLHCSCCRSLDVENSGLRNRIKELESLLSSSSKRST